MLTLAFNSRPRQSTRVAPLELVTPERIRRLSVERMVGSPTSEETDGSLGPIREVIQARLRYLIHKVSGPSRWHSGGTRGTMTLVCGRSTRTSK